MEGHPRTNPRNYETKCLIRPNNGFHPKTVQKISKSKTSHMGDNDIEAPKPSAKRENQFQPMCGRTNTTFWKVLT